MSPILFFLECSMLLCDFSPPITSLQMVQHLVTLTFVCVPPLPMLGAWSSGRGYSSMSKICSNFGNFDNLSVF